MKCQVSQTMIGVGFDFFQKSKSNGTHLFLKKVSMNLSGRYSCEVSADAPSFRTAYVSGDMSVVVIPSSFPEIQGMKNRYKVGDILEVQCISKDSRPAANLSWSLNNGKLLDSEYVKHETVKLDTGRGLETAKSTLILSLKPHHFISGRLKVKCTSSIHNVYWKTTENSAGEEKPKNVEPSTLIVQTRDPIKGNDDNHTAQNRAHCSYFFERLKISDYKIPLSLQLACLFILRYNLIS